MRKVKVEYCGGYEYLFTERECEIIEKYFDSIRQFMDGVIVDWLDCDDVIELVANYDGYLLKNNFEEEYNFSEIMFNEFGVNI